MDLKVLFTLAVFAIIVMMSTVEAAPATDMLGPAEREVALENELVNIFCGNEDGSMDDAETQGRKGKGRGKRGGKGKKGKKTTTADPTEEE